MTLEYGTFVPKDDLVISEASCHGLKENSRGLIQKKLYLLYYKKYNQKSCIFSTSRGKNSTELNNSMIYFRLNKEKSLLQYFISRIMHEKPSNLQLLNKKYLKRKYLHKGTLSLPDNYFCFCIVLQIPFSICPFIICY